MGYYSEITATTFKSRLNQEEMKAAWNSFVESQPDCNDKFYLSIYDIRYADSREYEIYMDDYFAKHYASRALAEFISSTIELKSYCKIEFVGEDGEIWGWLVLQGEVNPIAYEQHVCGQPITSFIESRHKEQDRKARVEICGR